MARTIEQTAIRNFSWGPACEHLSRRCLYRWQSLWLYFGNTLHSLRQRGRYMLFRRALAAHQADWLELLIQIAPRQATRGLRQSGQRQRRRPFSRNKKQGVYSTARRSRHLPPHGAISSAVCRRYHRSRPHHGGEPYIRRAPSIRQGSKAVFCDDGHHRQSWGCPNHSQMARIPRSKHAGDDN